MEIRRSWREGNPKDGCGDRTKNARPAAGGGAQSGADRGGRRPENVERQGK